MADGMVEIENSTLLRFDRDSIDKITNLLTDKDLELLIVDNETIQELNKIYRGIDRPTDVLSFPLADTPSNMLGSIVISADKVLEAAKEYGHTPQEELVLLYIHGLLHLLGYDHEIDEGQMRHKEKELIELFGLPASLIVRNS